MDKAKKAKLLEIRKKKIDIEKQSGLQKHIELLGAISSLHDIFSDSQEKHSETTDELLNKLEGVGPLKDEVLKVRYAIENIPETNSVTISNMSDILKYQHELDLTEVISSINELINVIKSKTIDSVSISNKKSSEYIPVRRVREVNGQFIFDDSPLQVSVVGGSNISTPYTNESGKNANVALIDGRVPVNTDLLPIETNNPSLNLSYTGGKITAITKTIDSVSYQKILTYTGDDLTSVSAWVEI